MKFVERENEIIKIIKKLSEAKLDFIVVGGYAVSSLAKHRFSVDCDLVVKKIDIEKFKEILETEGWKKMIEKRGFDQTYGGWFENFEKRIDNLPITVDLLVESIVSRTTNASWGFEYVKKHSTMASVSGIELHTGCRVPEKELLVAMKIHSARKTDIRDVIMLKDADWEKVFNHSKRGDIKILKDQIEKIVKSLEDKSLVDSLKGVFTLTKDVSRDIEQTRKKLEWLDKKIEV
jgi:predicted nucleotidyltransferase